jgi:hypothetical protein
MTTESTAKPVSGGHFVAGGSPADRASRPPPDPSLSWLPLLGSASILAIMLTLILLASYAK